MMRSSGFTSFQHKVCFHLLESLISGFLMLNIELTAGTSVTVNLTRLLL